MNHEATVARQGTDQEAPITVARRAIDELEAQLARAPRHVTDAPTQVLLLALVSAAERTLAPLRELGAVPMSGNGHARDIVDLVALERADTAELRTDDGLDALLGRVEELRADVLRRAQPPKSTRASVMTALLSRRTLASAGAALTIIGALVFAFVLYQTVLSDLQERRSQHELRAELEHAFAVAVATASLGGQGRGEGEVDFQAQLLADNLGTGVEAEAVIAPEPIAAGTAVALLEIDRLSLSKVVVEGTTGENLKDGPGHFRNTPMPGEVGNAVIAGRRTTYGSPFRNLDDLRVGDKIEVTTTSGTFVYEVVAPETDDPEGKASGRAARVVEPGEEDVLNYAGDNRLTLVTSDPKYFAGARLVVAAELVDDPVPPADWPRPTVIGANESALSGDSSGWAGVLLWGQLLVLTIVAALVLSRHWHKRATWLLTCPIALALLVLMFESFDRLLPATL